MGTESEGGGRNSEIGGGSKKRRLTSTFTVHYITVHFENTPLELTSVGKTPITLWVQEQHLHYAISQQQMHSWTVLTLRKCMAPVKFGRHLLCVSCVGIRTDSAARRITTGGTGRIDFSLVNMRANAAPHSYSGVDSFTAHQTNSTSAPLLMCLLTCLPPQQFSRKLSQSSRQKGGEKRQQSANVRVSTCAQG